MATFKDGILGGFTGKVGPVIGYQQGGKNIMRSQSDGPSKSRKPRAETHPQLARMELASPFVKSIAFLLGSTIRPSKKGMTNPNYVIQQITKYAIGGDYPSFFIDYSRVQLSYGFLPTVKNARTTYHERELFFTWTPNGMEGTARVGDKALLIAYDVGSKRVFFSFAVETRNLGSAKLALSGIVAGEFHTWLIFLSENGKEASPTIYCGNIIIDQD